MLFISLQPMTLDVGEELHLWIQFNPAYEDNLHSRVAERVLRMRLLEHPHEERVTVRGEVFFPNLLLEAEAVDFGCIINDTEQVLYMEITNCSPIPVQYRWSFLMDHNGNAIRCVHHPCTAPSMELLQPGFGVAVTELTTPAPRQGPCPGEELLLQASLSPTAGP